MYVLISISIFVAIIFLILFVKSVKNGQFDDGYTPSIRMLFEDEVKKQSKTNKNNNSN